jgi:hypothetical protein
MERLQMKIPVASWELTVPERPAVIALDKTRSPYWHYAGAGAAIFLAYLVLLAVGRIWDPMR